MNVKKYSFHPNPDQSRRENINKPKNRFMTKKYKKVNVKRIVTPPDPQNVSGS